MSSESPIPQRGSYFMSPEKCQEMFRDFNSDSWAPDVPDHHKEILEELIADYCKNGVEWTPWEEFEKELFEELIENTPKALANFQPPFSYAEGVG